MFDCTWIEGTRTFNVIFGAVTSGICLAIAIPIVWWILPKHRVWLFSREVDRNQGVQLAYGILCMSMAFTDALCRGIPHKPLPFVHPAFFLTTLIIAFGIGPRVAWIAFRQRRLARFAAVPAVPRRPAGLEARP
jgi:hypothetical protein